jgi:hypothetical protein
MGSSRKIRATPARSLARQEHRTKPVCSGQTIAKHHHERLSFNPMKGLVWIPEEEHEQRINAYLSATRQAPYGRIGAIALGVFFLMALGILLIIQI